MQIKEESFQHIKSSGEELYKKIDPIHCPFLKDKVFFNAKGLEHLKFKQHRHARSKEDQYMRFKLLHLAPSILKSSSTLQGVWQTKSFERIRIHSRVESRLVPVVYYEFIAVLEDKRTKVIVKQIDGGQFFFWSIIPYWGTTDRSNRKLHSGKPDRD